MLIAENSTEAELIEANRQIHQSNSEKPVFLWNMGDY